MAATRTYQDALTLARAAMPGSAFQTVEEYAVNMAVSRMWLAYDWRGTVAAMEPFWLVPGQQDYGLPFYSVPEDFYGLREAYVVWVLGSGSTRRPLKVVENIEATGLMQFPSSICYRAAISGFRTWPRVPFGVSTPNYLVDGTYKIRPPNIERADFATVLPWDDVYFEVFVQALGWAGLVCLGRRREAAEAEAVFGNSLRNATSSEAQELGSPSIHPTEPLLIPSGGGGGPWIP